MDPMVLTSLCKGNKNAELTGHLIRFLVSRCDFVEDTNTLDSTEFITIDQKTCYQMYPDLAALLIVSNPVNIYRGATGLFVNFVCLRLRNPVESISLLSTVPGGGEKYEYGSETRIVPSGRVNCRFRLDKSTCDCRAMCNSSGWANEIRDDLEQVSSDDMLLSTSANKCSIREYATVITSLPSIINEKNKEMAKSTYHGLNVLNKNKESIGSILKSIREVVESPLIDSALTHYKNSLEATSRMIMQDYARYCLETQNVNFLMGINKRTFHSVAYALNGFRYSRSDYKDVGMHQFIISIRSALTARDYYSRASERNAAAMIVEDNEYSKEFSNTTAKGEASEEFKDMEMYLKIAATSLMMDEYEEEEEEEEEEQGSGKRKRDDDDQIPGVVDKKAKKDDTLTTTISPLSCDDDDDDDLSFTA
ncbi:hypothetical protein Pcinc_008581 [Petrolisthes cinctipes]|uniref:Uncharacterized protein n=1 Tax=Petrolisthes cinctipes TaxID=88211 RepID=A0AAE1KXD6_PETCI|nr:hypothetical protein Pcinc_008581 [Petrolisthes cinctipes]